MTNTLQNDGLLKASRILVIIIQCLLMIAATGLVIAIPVAFFSQSHLAEAMSPDASVGLGALLVAISALLAAGATIVGIALYFLQLLKQIINSVGEGDPFITANADRLTSMGWLSVIAEVIKFPLSGLAVFVASQVESADLHLDLGFSLTGILIALLLFILARVFRHGAAMREDLEGTV